MQLSGKKIICYTDGSVIKNPGNIGAWAYIATLSNNAIQMEYGISLNENFDITSISMEFKALEQCISWCESKLKLASNKNNYLIYTDSQYLHTMFYKTNREDVKAHKERWMKIYLVKDKYKKIDVSWVRGHANCTGNNAVDNIMRRMYKALDIGIKDVQENIKTKK